MFSARTPARIMIVEDEAVIALDLETTLIGLGHTVVDVLTRGEEAAPRARETSPDLVLMDVHLRGKMDGIEAAQQVGALGVAIIFLTAYSDEATVERARAAQPCAFLVKPFTGRELQITIRMALDQHRARQAQARSERRLEATLSSIDEGLLAHDADNTIIFGNAAAETLLGVALRPGTPVTPALSRLTLSGPLPERGKVRAAIGERPVEVAVSPLRADDDTGGGCVIAIRDLTERLRSERAAELEVANAELERFAHIASHDLQEPLRTVKGYIKLVSRRLAPHLEGASLRHVTFITDGVERMERLIADLLVYSRAGRRVDAYDWVDMSETVDAVRQDLGAVLADSAGSVTAGPLPRVYGDPVKLRQLLQNLVSNALKFRGDAPPQVHVSSTETPAAWAFAVRDNGIGIAPEHQDRIFQAFQRLHHREQYEGTGIGLAVVRKLVEFHHGTLRVESTLGAGATFHFTLAKGLVGAPSP